jgi:FKBP-type peptidyl-prolyl cis-trans isomerase (trigger factor)
MAKVLESKLVNTYVFTLDYLIEKEEFTQFRDRIVNMLRQNVEISGFRKGKVPAHLADKELDPTKVLNVVYQETIQKYSNDAFTATRNEVEKQGKTVLNLDITVTDPELGVTKDETFIFRVFATLLPDINIEPIKTLALPQISDKDLPSDRPTKEENLKEKKQMLIDLVNKNQEEEAKKAQENTDNGEESKENQISQKVTTFQEALDSNPIFKQIYSSEESFATTYNKMYDDETDYIKEQIKQSKVIEAVLETVPKFDLPQETVTSEIERLKKVIIKEGKEKKLSLSEIYDQIGLPNPKKIKIKDQDDLVKALTIYVENEISLMWILRYVYEKHVEERITEKEMNDIVDKMSKKPQDYGLPQKDNKDDYYDIAFDRIIRKKAFDTILSWLD